MNEAEPAPFSLEDWERDLLLRLLTKEVSRARRESDRATVNSNHELAWHLAELAEATGALANRLADTKQVPRRAA